MLLLSKKEVLGIDIGSKVIKILQLKISGGKISVINFAEYDMGLHNVKEKSPEEKKQAYIDALKKLISSKKFTTKNAAISVSGSSVIVRFVRFPKMSESDLEKTLQFEAEPHIPFDIQEIQMDTHIIGDVEDAAQTKMETVLVAGKKDIVQERIEIIERAGFRPVIVDVDAFTMENAYELIHKEALSETVLLVNIGASITNISIVENGISKVVRDLYTAGDSFTSAIQENMQNSIEETEELKKRYGLLGGKAEEGKDVSVQIYNILYPVVKELNSELQRSIDYFIGQKTSADVKVEKVILSGGTANLKGLPELISSELKIPVEIFRPLEHVDTSSLKGDIDVTSPSLAVATGLAIRKIGDCK